MGLSYHVHMEACIDVGMDVGMYVSSHACMHVIIQSCMYVCVLYVCAYMYICLTRLGFWHLETQLRKNISASGDPSIVSHPLVDVVVELLWAGKRACASILRMRVYAFLVIGASESDLASFRVVLGVRALNPETLVSRSKNYEGGLRHLTLLGPQTFNFM